VYGRVRIRASPQAKYRKRLKMSDNIKHNNSVFISYVESNISMTEDKIGFKRLTRENWLKPDEITEILATFDNWQPVPFPDDGWISFILQPQLTDAVPLQIRRLFEIARSAMVYGYFFYPLYTLAGEQLFRVAETALIYKCKEIGAPKRIKNFHQKITYLIDKKVISEQDEEFWTTTRKNRNYASHPDGVIIVNPPLAIFWIELITEKINLLFMGN
jgi:hypothetical protein